MSKPLGWHPANPEPVKSTTNAGGDSQVSDYEWNARLLPEGVTGDQADGPFIDVYAYAEGFPASRAINGDAPDEYGVTLQLQFAIREDGDVNREWHLCDNVDVLAYDPTPAGLTRAMETARRAVTEYIEHADEYIKWDGKSEARY